MTTEGEVVKLLMSYNAIDLLGGAIYKSVGVEPRYTEIAVGILGNMACQREACSVMAANTKVMELIYWILQVSTDAPLLVETTRLVTTIFDSIREQVGGSEDRHGRRESWDFSSPQRRFS